MSNVAIGVTAATSPTCKRGLAVNVAAALASLAHDVALVDADPMSADVGTRLGVDHPAADELLAVAGDRDDRSLRERVARLEWPELTVVPAGRSKVSDTLEVIVPALRRTHAITVVDLPVAPGVADGPRLDSINRLVIAMTPDRHSVAAARRYLAQLATLTDRGAVAPGLPVGVVVTGDEGSSVLEPSEALELVDGFGVGVVPQWWGRARPNRGFGPTLLLPVLDLALHPLVERFVAGDLPRLETVPSA